VPRRSRAAVRRAGYEPWPKLFQNLRSTRETELAEQFPLHGVTAWIGNSERVAARHYLQLTDAHFRHAVGEPTAQNAAQKPAEASGNNGQGATEGTKGGKHNSRKRRGSRDYGVCEILCKIMKGK